MSPPTTPLKMPSTVFRLGIPMPPGFGAGTTAEQVNDWIRNLNGANRYRRGSVRFIEQVIAFENADSKEAHLRDIDDESPEQQNFKACVPVTEVSPEMHKNCAALVICQNKPIVEGERTFEAWNAAVVVRQDCQWFIFCSSFHPKDPANQDLHLEDILGMGNVEYMITRTYQENLPLDDDSEIWMTGIGVNGWDNGLRHASEFMFDVAIGGAGIGLAGPETSRYNWVNVQSWPVTD